MGTIKISRFNQPLKEFVYVEGETLSHYCELANITLTNGDVINTDYGEVVTESDEVEDDTVYSITQNFKNGSQ